MENVAKLMRIIEYATNSLYCPKTIGSKIRTRNTGPRKTNAKFVALAKARMTADLIRLGNVLRSVGAS